MNATPTVAMATRALPALLTEALRKLCSLYSHEPRSARLVAWLVLQSKILDAPVAFTHWRIKALPATDLEIELARFMGQSSTSVVSALLTPHGVVVQSSDTLGYMFNTKGYKDKGGLVSLMGCAANTFWVLPGPREFREGGVDDGVTLLRVPDEREVNASLVAAQVLQK